MNPDKTRSAGFLWVTGSSLLPVPLPPEQMQALLKGASPELVACDTSQRGWTHVTVTPKVAGAQWRFVSSVIEPTYTTHTGPELVATAGYPRLYSESVAIVS